METNPVEATAQQNDTQPQGVTPVAASQQSVTPALKHNAETLADLIARAEADEGLRVIDAPQIQPPQEVETEIEPLVEAETAPVVELAKTDDDDDDPSPLPKHLKVSSKSFVGELDMEIVALAKRAKVSISDATEIVNRRHGIVPAKAQEAQQEPKSEVLNPVAAIDAMIAEKRAEAARQREELNYEAATELENEIVDLRVDRGIAKERLAQEAQQQQASKVTAAQQAVQDGIAAALALYDGLDADTPIAKASNEILAEWEASGRPISQDPERFVLAAQRAALRLGIAPKGTKPAVQAPKSVATPQATRQVASPLSSGSRPAASPNTDYAARIEALTKAKDGKGLAALVGEMSRAS